MEDSRIGRVLDGRYRLLEQVGAGGMGVVYLAEHVRLGKQVAVKFLHKSSARVTQKRRRFTREANAMSRLAHPNLVSVIDHGAANGVPYLVMEYQAGRSLRKEIDRGRIEPARAVAIARQLLAGLGSAHARGVIHRDLKPENVLLVGEPGDEYVKLVDFGIAKLVHGDASDLTIAGQVPGTPPYMSPEQARLRPIDERADLYAAGIVLYEMVTGRRPFDASNGLVVMQMHVEQRPAPPRRLAPAISDQLEDVILRALEKKRERRWQGAGDFARALAATPEGRAAASPRRRGRVMLLSLFAAAAVAAWYVLDRGLLALPAWTP
jgi:serine/threonine protein kinase